MNPTPHDNSNDEDLLLAVRYVTGECDAVEEAAFEDRLESDPAAQAALVDATRIVAMLKATPVCPEFAQPLPQASKPQQKRPWVGSGQWGAVLASCVVVTLGVLWTMESGAPPTEGLVVLQESPALAQAWSAIDPEPVAAADADDDLADESEELGADVPDWLLTAVMVEQGEIEENAQDLDEETQL